jgi:hypothetical protein
MSDENKEVSPEEQLIADESDPAGLGTEKPKLETLEEAEETLLEM